MRFVIIDLVFDISSKNLIACSARSIQFTEQPTQLASIRLAQKGVKLFNKRRNRCFFMHGLVRKRTKL